VSFVDGGCVIGVPVLPPGECPKSRHLSNHQYGEISNSDCYVVVWRKYSG
jgi:hypothetical protein